MSAQSILTLCDKFTDSFFWSQTLYEPFNKIHSAVTSNYDVFNLQMNFQKWLDRLKFTCGSTATGISFFLNLQAVLKKTKRGIEGGFFVLCKNLEKPLVLLCFYRKMGNGCNNILYYYTVLKSLKVSKWHNQLYSSMPPELFLSVISLINLQEAYFLKDIFKLLFVLFWHDDPSSTVLIPSLMVFYSMFIYPGMLLQHWLCIWDHAEK